MARFHVEKDQAPVTRGHTMISAEVLGDLLCSTRNSTQKLVAAVNLLIEELQGLRVDIAGALDASTKGLEAACATQQKIEEAVEVLKEVGSGGASSV